MRLRRVATTGIKTKPKSVGSVPLTGQNKAGHNRLAIIGWPCFYNEIMKTFVRTLLLFLFLSIGCQVMADNLKEGTRLFEAEKYRAAMSYLIKPDAQTDPEAMNMIGFMYNRGLGIQKNPEEAYKWYRKAAEAGLAVSQFNVGLMYQYGRGVQKNIPEAVKWFRKAAEQNHASAELKMGYLTVKGIGVKRDYREAMKWYRRAAEHGDDKGYVNIGILYARGRGVKKDPNRAVQYYIMGAQKGEPDAQALLGTSYVLGKGIPQDNEKALFWYKKAAKNGSIEAMKELGYIYETGRLGVKKDLGEAERWNAMAKKAEEQE